MNHKTSCEEIGDYCVKKYGFKWHEVNQSAINAATQLGIDYAKPENKKLIMAVCLASLETFFNPKSICYVLKKE